MLYNQFPFYLDEENGVLYCRDMVDEQLIEQAVNDSSINYIVCDSTKWYNFQDKIYTPVLSVEDEIGLINAIVPTPNDFDTHVPVNFIYNKRQVNRHIAVKLLDYYSIDANYTYSGMGTQNDLSQLIQQKQFSTVPDSAMHAILTPMNIPIVWFDQKDQQATNGQIEHYGEMHKIFVNHLFDLYFTSAVSIITESIQYQEAAVITEKTAFSTYALTFPLWVGGYKQQEFYSEFGFDTFTDLINHDYQYASTLLERCWLAFELNKDLLQDPQIGKVRQHYKDRLIKNRDHMLSNPFKKWNDEMIDNMPKKLKASFEINRRRGRGY